MSIEATSRICPRCGAERLQHRGYSVSSVETRARYQCGACGCWPMKEELEWEGEETTKTGGAPRIVIFDIETSYIEGHFWKLGKQVLNKSQITRDWHLLSYSAKELYSSEVSSQVLTVKEALRGDDERIASGLWDIFDSADILVSYNGNRFDIPKANTRFMINGMLPPAPYRSVDVYQTVSRRFAYTSKSLDYVNRCLDLERKLDNSGIQLWRDCISGGRKAGDALQELKVYNIQDSIALEETYLRFLPWISNHPVVSKWYGTDEKRCGFCGSTHLKNLSKRFETPTGLYNSFRCSDCGGVGRSKVNNLSKEKLASLGKNV